MQSRAPGSTRPRAQAAALIAVGLLLAALVAVAVVQWMGRVL